MTKVRVLSDSYSRMVPNPHARGGFEHVTEYRGAEVDLEEPELTRALELGAVGSDEQLAGAVAASAEPPVWADEQIRAANVEDLVAYLQQRPSELDRVEALELARGGRGARKGVTDAIAEHRAAVAQLELEREEAARQAEADAVEAAARAAAGGAPTIPASA